VLWLVAAGCYRPTDLAHCAITCDPFANNCPGELVCGTDSFCHGAGESIAGCVAEVVDALPGPDALIIRLDAGPDARPDGGSSCVHQWVTDFSSDPSTGSLDRWIPGGGGGFPTSQLMPMGAPTYWAATAGESLVTSGSSAFATATTIDVALHPLDQRAAIQLNLNTAAGKSTQLTIAIEASGAAQTITLTNSSATTNPLVTVSVTDAFHHYQLGVKPNGGSIGFAIDGTAAYNSSSYAVSTGGNIGGVTLISTGNTQFDSADVCAQ